MMTASNGNARRSSHKDKGSMACGRPTCNGPAEEREGKWARCGSKVWGTSSGGHFLSGASTCAGAIVELLAGTRLGRFTVTGRLGGGNGSAVYLAQDSVRSEEVALKVVEVGPTTPVAEAQRLQREMTLHARIADHRHVVRVHDMHTVPNGGTALSVLSMEYAEGGNLRQWLHDHRQDIEGRRNDGLRFFKEACRGVGATYEAGIVHLDLKPENLMFVHGVLKVTDLGDALARETLVPSTIDDWGRFPVCPGTPIYMAPEQFVAAHPDDLDARCDIYALGVILFEILHPRGRPPFAGSFERLRELHLHIQPPELPDAGDVEREVIAKCMDKDPNNRYPDVWSLLDELEGRSRPTVPRPEPVDTAEADRLWEQASWHAAIGELNEATDCCRELLRLCPDHAEATRLLSELRAAYEQAEQLYNTIDSGIGGRGLTELVSLLQEAVALYPNHPAGRTAQANLAAKAQAYRQYMEAGWKAARDGFWDTATGQFERARELDAAANDASQALEFVAGIREHVQELRRWIDEAIGERDRRRAWSLACAVDEYVDDVKKTIARGVDSVEAFRREAGIHDLESVLRTSTLPDAAPAAPGPAFPGDRAGSWHTNSASGNIGLGEDPESRGE